MQHYTTNIYMMNVQVTFLICYTDLTSHILVSPIELHIPAQISLKFLHILSQKMNKDNEFNSVDISQDIVT